MTKAEIKEKIAKIEKGIASGQISPDYIPDLEAKRDALKKQLEDMEEAEKPAAKPAAEAKATPAATPSALSGKSKSELEKDIKNIKSAIAGTSNPKIKEALEKKLGIFEAELDGREDDKKVGKLEKEAEKKIKAVEKVIASPKTPAKEKAVAKKKVEAIKKVVKEAKKDAEKDKVARRRGRPRKAEAAQKVAAKRGRPAKAAVKPVAAKAKPVKAAKKPVVKRKTKAVVKLQKAVSSLEKLVRRSKELRAMYAGKGVDLERDAARGAKKPGWRLAGTNRRPTKADIKSRRAYYEARGNRADIQKSKVPKLAKGGRTPVFGYTLYFKNSAGNEKTMRTEAHSIGDAYKVGKSFEGKNQFMGYKFVPSMTQKGDMKYEMAKGGMMARGGEISKEDIVILGVPRSKITEKEWTSILRMAKYQDGATFILKDEKGLDVTPQVEYEWYVKEMMASGGMM